VNVHKQFMLEEFSVVWQRLLTLQIMKWTLVQNTVITLLLTSALQKNAQNISMEGSWNMSSWSVICSSPA